MVQSARKSRPNYALGPHKLSKLVIRRIVTMILVSAVAVLILNATAAPHSTMATAISGRSTFARICIPT